ncbi:GNAT family N-acetyltransferase [Nocardia jejuensis]|uniref:GNAT family N-acetyltransferase n=1 Tax=Nocardia jejuensis TaxID=328049 RepID=UPI000833E357|nr:GNAT family N-acetyltransferase [Nocardia jejuensis]
MTASDLPEKLEFHRYSALEARLLRGEVEAVFRSSYAEAIASGEPFESPVAFMARFEAYTSVNRSAGFELVMARLDGEPLGQTWGWPLPPNASWWNRFQLDEGDLSAFVAENGSRTFALSEVMVTLAFTGRGLARALHDTILGGRTEERATLLVNPANERAYRAYRNWGWQRAGTLRPSWEDAPRFDVLMRDLR